MRHTAHPSIKDQKFEVPIPDFIFQVLDHGGRPTDRRSTHGQKKPRLSSLFTYCVSYLVWDLFSINWSVS